MKTIDLAKLSELLDQEGIIEQYTDNNYRERQTKDRDGNPVLGITFESADHVYSTEDWKLFYSVIKPYEDKLDLGVGGEFIYFRPKEIAPEQEDLLKPAERNYYENLQKSFNLILNKVVEKRTSGKCGVLPDMNIWTDEFVFCDAFQLISKTGNKPLEERIVSVKKNLRKEAVKVIDSVESWIKEEGNTIAKKLITSKDKFEDIDWDIVKSHLRVMKSDDPKYPVVKPYFPKIDDEKEKQIYYEGVGIDEFYCTYTSPVNEENGGVKIKTWAFCTYTTPRDDRDGKADERMEKFKNDLNDWIFKTSDSMCESEGLGDISENGNIYDIGCGGERNLVVDKIPFTELTEKKIADTINQQTKTVENAAKMLNNAIFSKTGLVRTIDDRTVVADANGNIIAEYDNEGNLIRTELTDYEILQDLQRVEGVKCGESDWMDMQKVPTDCKVAALEIFRDITDLGLDRFSDLKELKLIDGILTKDIKKLSYLEEIDASYGNVEKIQYIEALRNLKRLWLIANAVESIEGIDGLEDLKYVDLSDNPVSFKYGFLDSGSLWIKGSPWEEKWEKLGTRYPRVKFKFSPENGCDRDQLFDLPEPIRQRWEDMCAVVEVREQADRMMREMQQKGVSEFTLEESKINARSRVNEAIGRVLGNLGESARDVIGITASDISESAIIIGGTDFTKSERCDLLLVEAEELNCDWL